MTAFGYRFNPRYAIKECSSCGTLYTRDCVCSIGTVEDKILVPKPSKNCARCTRCGYLVDGPNCQGCALLRQELEENLVAHSPDFQNTFEPSNASTNVVNAPREPYVVEHDNGSFVDKIIFRAPDAPDQFHCFHCKAVLRAGEACKRCTCAKCGSGLGKGLCYICGHNQNSLNDSPSISEPSSQSPPNINHCCYECGDALDGIFYKCCTCKSCRKDAHIGYNCPSKVLVISNPEPCNNQTIDELPQALPSFHSTFHSDDESPFTLDSTPTYVNESTNVFNPPLQSPVYPCEFCGNDAYYGHYCTTPALFIYPELCYNQDFNFPESEGIPEHKCDVPFHDNSPPLDVSKDQIEDLSESNKEFSSTDDDSFSFDNIDYVETSPPDSELVSSEGDMIIFEAFLNDDHSFDFQTKSSSTSLNSLLEETNNFHNSLPEFTNFSKVLFDAKCESDSSDDQSSSDEDVLEKIVLKPLSKEEIIPMESLRTHDSSLSISSKIDSLLDEGRNHSMESLRTHDSFLPISSKIDSLLDEFAGELALLESIPPRIDETDCDFEEDIRLIKKLLYDNSSPRPPEEFVSANSVAASESFSPSPILVKDSDSLMEEIDLFCTPDYPMPSGIVDEDYDSERDILIPKDLPSNNSL
nr:hypothetical protein [Tanacetum cinerariifolium]